MPMTAKQMIRLLKNHSFVEVRQVGSHKQFKNFSTNRSVTVPYHTGTLTIKTERSILKQAGLLH